MDDFVIKQRYTNMVFVVIACALFAIGSIVLILIGEMDVKIIGGLGVLFFGGGGFLYSLNLLKRGRLTLRITNNGLLDNAGNLIPWNNIKDVGIVNIFTNKLLGILLKDPRKYLKNVKQDKISKSMMRILTLSSLGTRSVPYRHSHRVPRKNLPKTKDTTSLRGMINYNLKTTGFHLTYPGGFDKSLEEIVLIIRKRIKNK